MNILEFEIEELARGVTCPSCGAKPDEPCRDWSARFKSKTAQNYSHLGRLKVARGERL
jgi:hypothetical protein